jgi:Tol biopolymer transport system component
LGPYEIIAPIGAGGMGEVYRARDTRLGRAVAIKISGEAFSSRFALEARAIAALNHPHICTLHDVGPNYLVMELVEGEALSALLRKGALPIESVLRYGAQIAEALTAAHEKGVIHRDLKPGNVMLTKAGVKVLDFGLARLSAPADAPQTEAETLTASRAVIGTPAYMAPEQLEGKECDARTDLFALGLLLYEMATAKRWSFTKPHSLSGSMPPALERTLKKALHSDPELRWQSARDFHDELEWIAEAGAAAPQRPAASRFRLAWMIAVALAAAGIGYWLHDLRTLPQPPALRATIETPMGTRIGATRAVGQIALSPDGKMLAVPLIRDEDSYLWVRRLDSEAFQRLEATRHGFSPFWSPDSRYIGFFAAGKLKKVLASGGPAEVICDATEGRGGTWNGDNRIVFCPRIGGSLYAVSAAGGEPHPITQLDASLHEDAHYWPRFLPDGRRFLFYARSTDQEKTAIRVGSLDPAFPVATVATTTTEADYAPATDSASPGHLFFVREGALLAQPFDLRRLALTGEPAVLAGEIDFESGYGPAGFSVSRTGTVAIVPPSSQHNVFVDRNGSVTGEVGTPGPYLSVALAPDGKGIASVIKSAQSGRRDIWLVDLLRGIQSRFSFYPQNGLRPVWSPDGRTIAYAGDRPAPYNLFRRSTAAGAKEEALLPIGLGQRFPTDWSRDGRLLLFEEYSAQTKFDLWVLSTPLGSVNGLQPVKYLADPFNESDGRFSPDGRFVAYTSDESGTNQVYVQTYPKGGGRWQISREGGAQPRWRGDGKELFYIGPKGALVAAPIRTNGRSIETGVPRALFSRTALHMQPGPDYDVTADGQRFLTLDPEEGRDTITILLNWAHTARN